jgi:hypothetical protein
MTRGFHEREDAKQINRKIIPDSDGTCRKPASPTVFAPGLDTGDELNKNVDTYLLATTPVFSMRKLHAHTSPRSKGVFHIRNIKSSHFIYSCF